MGQLSIFDIAPQEGEVEGKDTSEAPQSESHVVCHSDTRVFAPGTVIDLDADPEIRALRKTELASDYETHEARQKEENATEVKRASYWGFKESDASIESGWVHFRMVITELEFKSKKGASFCKLEIAEAPDGWAVGMWVPGHCYGPSIWDRYKFLTREEVIRSGLMMIRDELTAKLKSNDFGGGITNGKEVKGYLEQVKTQLLLVERGIYPEMQPYERATFTPKSVEVGMHQEMRNWREVRSEQSENELTNDTVVLENETVEIDKWAGLHGWLHVYNDLQEWAESDERTATIRQHIKSLTKEVVQECQDENLLQKVAEILKQHKSEPKIEPKEDVSEPVQEVRKYNFIEGDRKHNNETVLQMIEDGSVDPEKAIRYFTGWGGLIKATQEQIQEYGYTASNILAGGQYLTPLWVSEMITVLLPGKFLDQRLRVFDPTCGSGSLLWSFPGNVTKYGIEIEDTAIKVARAVMPNAQIIQDDVLYHVEDVENQMDVVVTNPPFGLHWRAEDETILERSGYEGRVMSHLATMEIAVRSLRKGGILFAILPQGTLDREDMMHFRRWIRNSCTEIGVIDLPKETFKPNGTEAKTFVWILLKDWDWQMSRKDQFFHQIVWNEKTDNQNPGHEAVMAFRQSEWWELLERHFARYEALEYDLALRKYNPNPEIPIEPWTKTLPETDVDVVDLKLGQYDIVMKPKGLIAALKVEELKNVILGPTWSYQAQDYEYGYKVHTNLKKFYTEKRDVFFSDLVWYLKAMGLRVRIDPQLLNWIKKKRKWFKRMDTPYEIFEGDPYEHIDENDMFGTVKEGDHVQALFNVHADYWYSYRYREGNYYQVLKIEGEGENRKVVIASEADDEIFEFRYQQPTEFEFKRWENNRESQTFEFNVLFGKVDMGFSMDQTGVMTAYRSEYKKWLKKFEEFPQFDYLFPYQKQDVARLALKPFNYLGYLQGLGKTDTTYALATIMGMKKVLIVCLSSLIDTWVEIAERIGLKFKVIVGPDDVKGIKATNETMFYIVSYEKMTSYSTTHKPGKCGKCGREFTGKECPVCKWKASKKWLNEHSVKSKQLYKYTKRITWSMVAVDESQCIKAKNSLRANAVRALKTRRKLLITGTIMKGWVTDCMPPDTLIKVKNGYRLLGDIVQDGSAKVMAFNFDKCEFEEKRVIMSGWSKKEIYEIRYEIDGKERILKCSGDHKIITKNKGEVLAKNLRENDELYIEN